MSFVEYLRVPDPALLEILTLPGLFLLVLSLSLLAGLRWHASLVATGLILAMAVAGLAAKAADLNPASKIGAALAALLLVMLWKLRPRKA
jgi:hypothetical protein